MAIITHLLKNASAIFKGDGFLWRLNVVYAIWMVRF